MDAVPSTLRDANQRAILDELLRRPEATRAQLAQGLGMSAPTAGKVIADLLNAGVIEEAEPEEAVAARTGLGRPGRTLRLRRDVPRLVLVQIGVRRTRVATAPLGVRAVDDAWAAEFDTGESAADWRRSLIAAAKRITVAPPWGVVASVPGLVDEAAGRVVFSPNLRWTSDASLPELTRAAWDAPLCLVQEIRALALGQQLATGDRDFFLCDVGDGVGGAAVIDGRLFESSLPMSGELGHTPVLGNDRGCGCGGVGCLETLVSRGGMLRSMCEALGTSRAGWPQLVERVAEQGVEPWIEPALDAAAVAIAGSLNVLGLRRAVLTGALAELGDAVVQHVAERVRAAAMWGRFGEVTCVAAPRRRSLGLVAAGVHRLISPVTERERASVSWPERLEQGGYGVGRARRGVLA